MRKSHLLLILLIAGLLFACTSQPIVAPSPSPAPTSDLLFNSNGGGEPRGPSYWLVWNSCAEGNQAEAARANGGREAGWVILDDLLVEPGVLLGPSEIPSCQAGIQLLQGQDTSGAAHAEDPAYTLAAQLLAAQLNLAVGSESCPAAEQAVASAQLLLISLEFDGTKEYLEGEPAATDAELARFLAGQLSEYNGGTLCR